MKLRSLSSAERVHIVNSAKRSMQYVANVLTPSLGASLDVKNYQITLLYFTITDKVSITIDIPKHIQSVSGIIKFIDTEIRMLLVLGEIVVDDKANGPAK
jgi:hypothetical protein